MRLLRFSWLCLSILACNPSSDIGKVCPLPNPDGGTGLWTATSSTNDIFYNGANECVGSVCLRPAGSPLDAGFGFCSDSCTQTTPGDSNSADSSGDCSGASIPIVCRQPELDPSFQSFLDGLVDAGDSALVEKYLGGTTVPFLCTSPTTSD